MNPEQKMEQIVNGSKHEIQVLRSYFQYENAGARVPKELFHAAGVARRDDKFCDFCDLI